MLRPTFVPRPAQARILEYTGGPMGISAVPGSGKTFTLSLLAAHLVGRLAGEGRLDEREVLVVTFTNSAVANFRSRINTFVRQERGLLPGVGYRVRTLHGLAHDIVRERPGLVGLGENFDIIDDRTASEIKREAVLAYLRSNPDAFASYIHPDHLRNPRSIEKALFEDANDIATAFIRIAKELGASPVELQASLRRQSGTWPLLDFGLYVYANYQRSLSLRGAVDFDDLIVFALQALRSDENYLLRLQDRWPYILEDEAQDSSLLQERMLSLLTARYRNWVRVGDPNQAINTTFTSANTRFLQNFIRAYPEQARELPNSGRCAQPILDLANYLIDWSRHQHPLLPQDLALTPPHIAPTPPGDPQPNPQPGTPSVYFYTKALTPDEEVKIVVASLQRWLPQNTDQTVAVLAPENSHGFRLSEELEKGRLPFDDSLLRSDSNTRAGAEALAAILRFIAKPTDPQAAEALETIWNEIWWPRKNPQAEASALAQFKKVRKADLPEAVLTFGRALAKLRQPESFLFPAGADWLNSITWLQEVEELRVLVERFRSDLRRWSEAIILPVDELMLTVGNDLFTQPSDLALNHYLALMLAKRAQENPQLRLADMAGELEDIAQNRRRILSFSEEAGGYEAKPGVITIATMHAAKGLEWDRVYLLAVNNFGFPSGSAEDKYRSERWYVREQLNLGAEMEAQVRQLHMGTLDDYQQGRASQEARLSIAAERLRLFYVGITRARRELIVTYNTGRLPDRDPNRSALAFEALTAFQQKLQ